MNQLILKKLNDIKFNDIFSECLDSLNNNACYENYEGEFNNDETIDTSFNFDYLSIDKTVSLIDKDTNLPNVYKLFLDYQKLKSVCNHIIYINLDNANLILNQIENSHQEILTIFIERIKMFKTMFYKIDDSRYIAFYKHLPKLDVMKYELSKEYKISVGNFNVEFSLNLITNYDKNVSLKYLVSNLDD